MAGRYVALLRGINVGGRNKLPMAELVSIFEGVGCGAVSTYIQSGNVVFEAAAVLARKVPGLVAGEISARLSLAVPVVVRSAKEMAAIAERHPLAGAGLDESLLGVMFLADRPKAAAVAKLDPDRSPGDTFQVVGSEIFTACPNGVARSKLTAAYFDKSLGTVSTARNWRTVRKLAGLSREPGS